MPLIDTLQNKKKRAQRLLWRGVVAGATTAAMGTGLYPIAPFVVLRWASLRRREQSRVSTCSMASEWAVSAVGAATRPLGLLGERMAGGDGPRPVILLHGYGMSRSSFLVLARRLARAGLGPIFGFEYWSLGKVSSASRRLDKFIEEVCVAQGCQHVDVVAHSMGGLVARYYLTLGPGRDRDRIANLVTLGTPHGGTEFSLLGIGRAQVEMQPKAAFFQRLENARLPASTKATVLWSRADSLVWSERQAHWPGTDEVIYDDLGHVSLLYSRRVASEIIGRLEGDT